MEISFTVDERLLALAKRFLPGWVMMTLITILVAAAGLTVFADDDRLPHVFQSGDVITAARINDNFRALQNQLNRLQREVKGVPVGTIAAYGGSDSSVPPGWLLCNGRELGRSEFPELFAVIGTLWGDGNSVTTFNLPDLRGLFLRGVNHGRTGTYSDPDASDRVNHDGSIAGDRAGSYQDDMFKSHYHSIYYEWPANHANGNWGDYSPSESSSGTHKTSVTGGNETRSVNAAVNYIIKVE